MKIELALIKDTIEHDEASSRRGEWSSQQIGFSYYQMKPFVEVVEIAKKIADGDTTLNTLYDLQFALDQNFDFNPELPDWVLEMRGLKEKPASETAVRNEDGSISLRDKVYPYPVVGEDVYVPTSLYMSHGADDFVGGLCEITSINDRIDDTETKALGYNRVMITIKERPGTQYNWFSLCDEQEELKERFGDNRGYPDPDDRPEFNRWD